MKWDKKFDALAVYNAERYRGIVHTLEYTAHMVYLQAEYDKLIRLSN